MSKDNSSNGGCGLTSTILGVLTSMIGYHIHGSIFWAIMDLFFFPLAWIKWLLLHQVNIHIIKDTFTWFFE